MSGDTALVGSIFENENGTDAGAVYRFEYDDEAEKWNQIDKIVASDGSGDEFFGHSTSIDGAHFIVGAFLDDTANGTNTGSAYIYEHDGDDLFVFANGDGNDTINDFKAGAGTNDVMDVTDFGFADAAAVIGNASQVGADTVIQLDADDSVTLLGVNVSDLHEDDFLI